MAVEVTALDAASPLLGSQARSDRWPAAAAAAGGLFLLALAAGTLLAPAAPPPYASRLSVHEYFVAHHDAVLNQSLLVHGVAGVALVVLAVSSWRMFDAGVRRAVFLVSGLAAAAASFLQLDIVLHIENHIENGVGVRRTDALFDALNRAGAVKFAFLGVAVAAACALVPRHVRWVAYVAVSILGLAAAALVTQVPASHALLFFVRA